MTRRQEYIWFSIKKVWQKCTSQYSLALSRHPLLDFPFFLLPSWWKQLSNSESTYGFKVKVLMVYESFRTNRKVSRGQGCSTRSQMVLGSKLQCLQSTWRHPWARRLTPTHALKVECVPFCTYIFINMFYLIYNPWKSESLCFGYLRMSPFLFYDRVR